jgi:ribosome-binding protein aMBF1 (putative translation factor)
VTHKSKPKANGKKGAKAKRSPAELAEARMRKRAGRAITKAMKRKGYTITTLSDKLKCEASTISRYCAGLRFPVPSMMRILCKELGLSADQLM